MSSRLQRVVITSPNSVPILHVLWTSKDPEALHLRCVSYDKDDWDASPSC
jgi:hypothetical protein